MRAVLLLVLVTLSGLGVGCNQGAVEKEQLNARVGKLEAEKAELEAELKKLRAGRKDAPDKTLAEKLLGDWGKTDANIVRGLSIKPDGTATVSLTPGERKGGGPRPPIVVGDFLLAGTVLQITDRNDKVAYLFEIVSVTNDELTLRTDGFSQSIDVLKRF